MVGQFLHAEGKRHMQMQIHARTRGKLHQKTQLCSVLGVRLHWKAERGEGHKLFLF
jgi:hypothetical protein